MSYLLDANALIAYCFSDHIHHKAVKIFFENAPRFFVCPITEGALVRFIFRTYPNEPGFAEQALAFLARSPECVFLSDHISYSAVSLRPISGHKQVTDAYLVALAEAHKTTLATFDSALTVIHKGTVLIPLSPP